jgi:hypothetical protein
MPGNAHDDSLLHFSKSWYKYFLGEERRKLFSPNDLYGNYSSVNLAVAREEDPASDPGVRKFYPGTETSNPLRLLSRARQLDNVEDGSEIRLSVDSKVDSLMDPSKAVIVKSNVKSFLESDAYGNGLRDHVATIQATLKKHYENTKKKPAYAGTTGRWDLEKDVYLEAKKLMRASHKEDVNELVNHMVFAAMLDKQNAVDPSPANVEHKTYLEVWKKEYGVHEMPTFTSFEKFSDTVKIKLGQKYVFDGAPDAFNDLFGDIYHNVTNYAASNAKTQSDFLRKYEKEIASLPGVSMSVPSDDSIEKKCEATIDSLNAADTPEARKLKARICAEALLEPIHSKEINNLEKTVDASRLHYLKEHDKNARWSRIVAQQDESLIAAAQKVRKTRCNKILEEERSKLKEQNDDAETAALFTVGSSVPFIRSPADGELLPDSFRLAHDPDGLPTLEDFKVALESPNIQQKGIKFRFQRNHYIPGVDSAASSRKSYISVTFGKGDQINIHFDGGLSEDQIRRDPNIRDAAEDLAETLWSSYDQKDPPTPPSERRANLVATSEAQAEVLVRAALMRGFKVEKLSMTIKADLDIDDPKNDRVLNIQNDLGEAVRLAKKYHRYVDYQAENSVEALLGRMPAAVEENASLYKDEQAYNDAKYAFEQLMQTAAPNKEPLSPEENARFVEAVNRLNSIQFGRESRLTQASNIAGGVLMTLPNTAGYLLTDRRAAARELFKTGKQTDNTLAVQETYTLEERRNIYKAAEAANTNLETEWSRIESQAPTARV